MNLAQSNLYHLFARQDRATWGGVLFAALAAGLMQGGMVVAINNAAEALAAGGPDLRLLLMFLLLLGAYALASHYAASRSIAVSERATFATYVAIADKLRHARLQAFERLGKQHVYATLHGNTDIVLETAKNLAGVGAGVVMVLFSAVYVATISPLAILTVAVFYLFGYFVYRSNLGRVQGLFRETGPHERRFKARFTAFLEGFKELKGDRDRADALLEDYVRPDAARAEAARVRAERQLSVNLVFVQAYYYFMVASMLFLLPRIGSLSDTDVLKVAAVMLFSYGSMTRIVQSIPLILKAEKALAGLHELERELDAAREPDAPAALPAPAPAPIRLEAVTFTYHQRERSEAFTLGPLSLEVRPGEVLFIVGGNGSGKTTLLKLLAGLYPPESGALYLDGRRIGAAEAAVYRQRFAVIFPDYHLFDRFYGHEPVDEARLREALETMGLGERVDFSDGGFGDLDLSSGQRKRLALACAQLDPSPVLVLDEVAADLDPAFRRFFYETWLPGLRAAGRTVIAVSHDEHYFHVADRVLKLDAGRLAH